MFITASSSRIDFADTQAAAPDAPRVGAAATRQEAADAADLIASADAADRHLLRLVACAAAATLLLALATSLSA